MSSHSLHGVETGSLSSSQSLQFSMELEPDVNSQIRKYPSIAEYYRASSKDSSRPIQLQSGLSNYSNLVLGDDRISVAESVLSATYRIPVEDKMAIDSPSKQQSRNYRRREYQDALKKVGETEINRLERVMKDKLFQRSYATSSPFQVRKAFKFFDREHSLRIPIEGFTRALEFLGFQFSELQNTALFAKYDKDFSGEIDYMHFISVAMFYAAVEPDFGDRRKRPPSQAAKVEEFPDIDSEEIRKLQEVELRKVFNKVDRAKSGSINKDDFELLLMALGHHLSLKEIDACWQDMGLSTDGGVLTFNLFFEWWTDSMGMDAIRKKYQHK